MIHSLQNLNCIPRRFYPTRDQITSNHSREVGPCTDNDFPICLRRRPVALKNVRPASQYLSQPLHKFCRNLKQMPGRFRVPCSTWDIAGPELFVDATKSPRTHQPSRLPYMRHSSTWLPCRQGHQTSCSFDPHLFYHLFRISLLIWTNH